MAMMLWMSFLAALATGEPARAGDGLVVLPIEDYRALKNRAEPLPPEPPPPPVEAVLTRVEYDLRSNADMLTGEARLTIDVIKEGWARVRVPAGLLVREARQDGKPIAILAGEAGKMGEGPSVLLKRKGRAQVTLDLVVPLTQSAGTESFTLPPSLAAITRVRLAIPRGDVDLTITGGLLADKTGIENESRFSVFAQRGEAMSFTWRQRKEDQRARQPLRMRGTLVESVGLGEDGAQLRVNLELAVSQGVARAAQLQIPDGVIVNQVAGENVADWVSQNGQLKIAFLEPVDGATSVIITGEVRLPREGKIAIPILRLDGVERESGGVALEVLGAGEIKGREVRGLDPALAAELGEALAGRDSPSLVVYRFRSGEARMARVLTVDVARYTPQAVIMANIEEARFDTLLTEEGKTLVRAQYAVRNNQRSFLKIALPDGATLWSAAVARKPIRPGRAEDGALLLPLLKGRAGEEAPVSLVEISYMTRDSAWSKTGRARISLPKMDIGISRTGVRMFYPPSCRIQLEPGAFRETAYRAPMSRAFTTPVDESDVSPGTEERKRAEIGIGKKDTDAEGAATVLKGLVDKFQKESGRIARTTGILPVSIPFPAYGPTVFCLAELTAESTAPTIEFSYKKGK
ncbi:MAG: hypothetical protein MUF51_02310 [Vicinamibacteria bacterium]|nr:hypothetical protein [Vicinamibacteria bacterium]